MSPGIYFLLPVVILLAIAQATILPHLPVLNVAPGLWLVITVAWSLLRGMREGLLLAFVGGLFVDLLSAAPMGITPLSLMLAVALVTFLQNHLPRNQYIIPALLTALATIIFWMVYLLLLRIIMPTFIVGQQFLGISDLRVGSGRNSVIDDIRDGYGMTATLLRFVVQSALIHGLLAIPLYWGVSTLQRLFGRRPVEI